MDKANFTVEDIHAIRMETAEKYRNMSPKEAEKDFNQHLKKCGRYHGENTKG